MIKNLGEKYSPLYFLASLGFGGMSVAFFMIFMHLTPHPKTPIPTYETIQAAWNVAGPIMKAAIITGYVGMFLFFAIHLFLLAWNLREFFAFKQTPAYQKLVSSNAEITLMAIPLTLAMTVNGLFMAFATTVPNLWSVVEYLFPWALVAYALTGALALKYLAAYVKRILTAGFDFEGNGGLNQLLSAFAFAMVSVGFAAPAAMSDNKLTVLFGMAGALFFGVISALLLAVFLPMGAMSMFRYKLTLANSATLWLMVPIMTLWSITFLRLRHGTFTLADAGAEALGKPVIAHAPSSMTVLVILGLAVSIQLAFLMGGHAVMQKNGFYKSFVFSQENRTPAPFTLVCPGVALTVLGYFFLHIGLVKNGLIESGTPLYAVAMSIIVVAQLATIGLMLTLTKNQLFPKQA